MKNKIIILLSILSCGAFQASDVFKAIEQNNKKEIKAWLKNNPDVDLVNDQGQTALIKAVQQENKYLVAQLLKCGAEVNKVDRFVRTALDYAVELGNKKIAKMLTGVSGMVTTESNAVRCRQLIMSTSGWRIFGAISIGVVCLCAVAMGGFAVMMAAGVPGLMTPVLIAGFVIAGVGAGAFYGLVKLGTSKNYYREIGIIQPTA